MNLWLPYAMLHRGSNKGGVSFFALFEVIPLLIAVALSFLSSQEGLLAAKMLFVFGMSAVVLSYLHLFVVLFLAFYIFGRGRK
jgi:hypothetical protein